tara:strand:+ start:547 stop:990 length:444 start_codon:yes stop_codon:yes gene_type:complete
MARLDFTLDLEAPREQLMKEITNYQKLSEFLPDQLKNIEIIEHDENKTITRETIFFSTMINKPFVQESIHRKISSNKVQTEIISGPARETLITMVLDERDDGTNISIEIELKLSLKAIILQPLIKKWYKRILTSTLYKINNSIMNES